MMLFILFFLTFLFAQNILRHLLNFVCTNSLNSKTVPVLPSVNPSLIFPFHLLPSLVHPIGFSFYSFPGFLAIFILLSSNNNNIITPDVHKGQGIEPYQIFTWELNILRCVKSSVILILQLICIVLKKNKYVYVGR